MDWQVQVKHKTLEHHIGTCEEDLNFQDWTSPKYLHQAHMDTRASSQDAYLLTLQSRPSKGKAQRPDANPNFLFGIVDSKIFSKVNHPQKAIPHPEKKVGNLRVKYFGEMESVSSCTKLYIWLIGKCK